MDTVTYPDARVQSFLAEHFELTLVNVREPNDDSRELLRTVKPQWAPLFLARDARGTELRRWFGWLAPEEFVAELTLVVGLRELLRQRFDEALARFREGGTAEALWWAGAAAYKTGGLDALRGAWDELTRRFPIY